MADLASPDEFSSDLTDSRLSVVGELMLNVLAQGIEATSTPLDCAYTRAVLPWGWIRNALRQLAQSGQYEWLTIRHAGNDLVIGVGEVPVRFFIDHHANPRKPRVLSPTEGEVAQLVLPFAQLTSNEPALWRFIVERALADEDENRVFFVGYNMVGEIVAKWEFTESVRTFRTTDSEIPAAAVLGPIPLSPIFPIDDAANETMDAAENGDGPRST